jgi:hypothetical protein
LKNLVFLLLLLAGVLCPHGARGEFEPSYWVWHRAEPLSASEGKALYAQGVRRVYWHTGSLRMGERGWLPEAPLQVPPPKYDVPVAVNVVIRLMPQGTPALDDTAADTVAGHLKDTAARAAAAEAQLDFDCPDRRLGEYARFLARVRSAIAPVKLSATALAGWARLPEFEALQNQVDALFPMFYDLEPDDPARNNAGQPRPLMGQDNAVQVAAWKSCRVPWYAGLPSFARVSVLDAAGRPRGQLRSWSWDEISFHPDLLRFGPADSEPTVLKAGADLVIANIRLQAGEALVCRTASRHWLAGGRAIAEQSGARGVCFFRLPGEGAAGGWSLPQLGTVTGQKRAGEPEFRLRWTGQALELANNSATDLPPRLDGGKGDRDRGWQLEVEPLAGPSAVFREAGPGEFAAVYGHADPESEAPPRTHIQLAERLTYWFGDLRAAQTRRAGLLQLQPGLDPVKALRWRIPGSPKNSDWQPVE